MERDPLEPMIVRSHRHRRRQKRRVRVRLGKWVGRATLAAALLGVSGVIVARAVEPYTMRYRQTQETRKIRRDLEAAQAQNMELKRQIEMLRSGIGLELEARKLGYIKKGEIPLQITIEEAVPEKAQQTPPEDIEQTPSEKKE